MQKPSGVAHIELCLFVGFPSRPEPSAAWCQPSVLQGSWHPVRLTGCCSRALLTLPRISLMKWTYWSTFACVFFPFYIVREGTLKGIASALLLFMLRLSPDGRMFVSPNRCIHLYQLIGVAVLPVYPLRTGSSSCSCTSACYSVLFAFKCILMTRQLTLY